MTGQDLAVALTSAYQQGRLDAIDALVECWSDPRLAGFGDIEKLIAIRDLLSSADAT